MRASAVRASAKSGGTMSLPRVPLCKAHAAQFSRASGRRKKIPWRVNEFDLDGGYHVRDSADVGLCDYDLFAPFDYAPWPTVASRGSGADAFGAIAFYRHRSKALGCGSPETSPSLR